MLSDLLDLSRADNHQLKILNEPFPVQLSCYQTLKLARAAYTNKISDNLDSTEEVFAVGDPDRLVQCLENLIGNAAKYSDLDTPIALELGINHEYIEVSIIDSGQGIPADEQDLIFERFKRAGGVVLRKGQTSSGLGLSIVKMLVEGMGGEIFVLSEVGNGSKFTIKLPRFNSGL